MEIITQCSFCGSGTDPLVFYNGAHVCKVCFDEFNTHLQVTENARKEALQFFDLDYFREIALISNSQTKVRKEYKQQIPY